MTSQHPDRPLVAWVRRHTLLATITMFVAFGGAVLLTVDVYNAEFGVHPGDIESMTCQQWENSSNTDWQTDQLNIDACTSGQVSPDTGIKVIYCPNGWTNVPSENDLVNNGAIVPYSDLGSCVRTQRQSQQSASRNATTTPPSSSPSIDSSNFATLSGNIACSAYPGVLDCTVLSVGGSSGLALWSMHTHGNASYKLVHSNVVAIEGATLEGAEAWARGGFHCQSSGGGIKCTNEDGHGFFLRDQSQQLF